jgi:hypothetical protein
MKKLFLFLVVMVAATTASFAQKGVMKFKEETHNFGKIAQNKPVTVDFVFTNTGKEPIVISNVSASCGCTTPSYTKEPVLPGKTGSIKATYNAAAMGPFNKSITIFSNSESPTLTLFLKGEVIATAKSTSQK